MTLNISENPKFEEGVWVEFDEDVSFKVRYTTQDTIRKIRKKFVKKKWKRGQEVEDVNEDGASDALYDYILIDWKGIELEPKKPAKCTPENKKKLINVCANAALFVLHSAQDLANFRDKQEAQEVKN